MNILFVCKYNRFRSQAAEAFFNRYNQDKKIKAHSAGIIRGRPIDSGIKKAAKMYGLKLKGMPEGLSVPLLKKQDLIVIVADDVPKEIFTFRNRYVHKMIQWNIPDVRGSKIKERERIIGMIDRKVQDLVESLK